ncbi:MAG: aminomethyl transferase family protein [Thermodesulfobacteriota bacterium]
MKFNRTPLYRWHLAQGARLTDFGGWEMPLWYPAGAVREHLAVITGAGVFDTSHMSVLSLAGPEAFDLLQLCFSKDLRGLAAGRCAYGVFLNEDGGVIDDAIVYHIGPGEFMIVVNAGQGPVVPRRLADQDRSGGAVPVDLTAEVGKMDLQGPRAGEVLARVLEAPGEVVGDLRYFSFRGHFDPTHPTASVRLKNGPSVLVSRTGYTGEYGFEIFTARERLIEVWESLMAAGAGEVLPCGLAARDSLRAGAGLPLSHQDLGPWPFINNPWTFALPFTRDGQGFTKNFLGEVVLSLRDRAEHTLPFLGHDPRKVSLHDPDFGPARVLDRAGREIGTVLTCVADMALGRDNGRVFSLTSSDRPAGFQPKGICCGFVKVKSRLPVGEPIELIDKRRRIGVTVASDLRPGRTARRIQGRLS